MPVQAVKLFGMRAEAAELTAEQETSLAAGSAPWIHCPIANKVGVPLMMLRLKPGQRDDNENPAFLMLAELSDGLAPPNIQIGGVGPCLLARKDKQDFSVSEMWDLHGYQSHLMDFYPDWNDDPARSAAAKAKMQTPEAFKSYTTSNSQATTGLSLNDHNVDFCCSFCLMPEENEKLLKCGRCKKARYCSKECQKEHWRYHKKECKPK